MISTKYIKHCCTGKLNRFNDRKIYKMLTENATEETLVTSPCFSVVCLDFENLSYGEQALAYQINEVNTHYIW
jgi:hypothetical protein